MNCIAIADRLIDRRMMAAGLDSLRHLGIKTDIVEWQHDSVERLQQDNLLIERQGADAVALPQALLEQLVNADILITQFAPLNARLFERAGRLKLVGVLRGGTENVDGKAAAAHGVVVLNTPGRNARSVAEFTVGLMLAETRNIARAHHALQRKHWRKDFPNHLAIPELAGKTVGLVGFGNIARQVADLVSAFDARAVFYDKYVSEQTPYEQVSTLESLVRRADILSLHARLTPETAGMIDAPVLGLMKPGAILVNTARSGLVDEAALIRALQSGQLTGAALDTFDREPLPDDSPFYVLDNVTLTCHQAGSTLNAFARSPVLLAARIAEWHQQRANTGRG